MLLSRQSRFQYDVAVFRGYSPNWMLRKMASANSRENGLSGNALGEDCRKSGGRSAVKPNLVLHLRLQHMLIGEMKGLCSIYTAVRSLDLCRAELRLNQCVSIGAYYTCSAASHRLITIPLAKYLDARLFGT